MKKSVINSIYRTNCCPVCGKQYTNPGYSSNSVYCCGVYGVWRTPIGTCEVIIDDGRDAQGRFHHRPYSYREGDGDDD